MVRPLARQAWQSDADRIDSLERWRITAPLQADHLAELAALRAKQEAPGSRCAATEGQNSTETRYEIEGSSSMFSLIPETVERHRQICEVEGFSPTVRRYYNPTPGALEEEVAATLNDWNIHADRDGICVIAPDMSEGLTPTYAATLAREMLAVTTMATELDGLNDLDAAKEVLSQLGAPKPVEHPEIGDTIKRLRESFDLTLEDVEREELIEAKHLAEIEAGTLALQTGDHGLVIDAIVATYRIKQAEAQQIRRPVDACAAPEFDGIV